MITAVGVRTDPTIRHFCLTAQKFGAAVRLVDLTEAVEHGWEFRLPPDDGSWVAGSVGARIHFDPEGEYYCRLIDLGAVSPAATTSWSALITGVGSWLELCQGVIVNRPGHANDNACKPLHEALLARAGFAIPPSFASSSRSDLMAFVEEGPTIAKALSGQRADCRIVTVDDFADYDERSGPVNLQRFVNGDDVRAHVIGDDVISVRIRSAGPDYRMTSDATFELWSLGDEIDDLLRRETRSMGLAFAGWDLRVDDSECWVLEANPMPGYSYYDTKVSGRITLALIEFFRGVRRRTQW